MATEPETSSLFLGEEVPTPMFPVVEIWLVVLMVPKPPAIEPEARAPIEVKEEAVTPLPKVVPERTSVVLILKVEPLERLRLPATSNFWEGAVVPIPTLPEK